MAIGQLNDTFIGLLYAWTQQWVPPGGSHNVCKLFQNNIVPSLNTHLADFVEADFTGYASVNVDTWSSPYLTPEGTWEISTPALIVFNQTDTIVTNTIYGYWMENSDGGLLMAERFATPIEMDAALKALQVLPRMSIAELGGTALVSD